MPALKETMAKPKIKNMLSIQKLKPIRKLPKTGDIFCYKTSDGLFRFGKVVKDDAVVGPFRNSLLIYLYSTPSKNKDLIPPLSKKELLFAPIFVDASMWRKGFFQQVKNEPLAQKEVFLKHCFQHRLSKKFFDEYSKELPRRIEPVGDFALHFDQSMCNQILSALNRT